MWWGSRISCHCLPDHGLDLLFVFGIYFVAVLGPHQHGCEAESRVLQACSVTLDHRGRQDWHDVCNTHGRAESPGLLLSWLCPRSGGQHNRTSKFAFPGKEPDRTCFMRKGCSSKCPSCGYTVFCLVALGPALPWCPLLPVSSPNHSDAFLRLTGLPVNGQGD